MRKKQHILLTIILVMLILLGTVNFNEVKAAGATLTVSDETIAPGGTFELYVNLNVESVGYDLNVTETGVIGNKVLTSKVSEGDGDANRFWLIQVSGNPTIHQIGENIATIEYTVSDTAQVGDNITINVKGDIVGKNSDERNSMDESITLKVGESGGTEISATGVTLDQSNITLEEGETKTITATVTPSGANQEVTWTSDNANVATVDSNGKITAIGEGTANITVTTKDGGFTATCTVQVTKNNNSNNNNSNNNNQSSVAGETTDTTTANKPIIQAGENIGIIIAGIVLLVIGIITLIRFKRIK